MVSLRIALRYLFSKKSHSAVNIISVISMAGVAVATVAIVCVLSVFNGFSDLAMGRLSVIDPEMKLLPESGKIIRDADSLAARISALPGVDTAMATVDEQALAIVGPRQMAVRMKGVPSGYNRVSGVDRAVIDGEYGLDASAGPDDPVALLSVGTAVKLASRPASMAPFALYVPRRVGRINPSAAAAAFRSDSLTVTGVYEIEDAEKDASTVMVPLTVARDLLDYDSEASMIEIGLEPGASESAVRDEIGRVAGAGYVLQNRLQQEEKAYRMISIEKWIAFIMLAFILLIASFNVISTLSMLMLEKTDNMVTLRALGARQSMIRGIFVWEGWLISIFGGIIGIVTGVGLCLLQQYCGLIRLSGDASQLSVTVYPVRVYLPDLLVVMGLVVLTGLFIAALTTRFARR